MVSGADKGMYGWTALNYADGHLAVNPARAAAAFATAGGPAPLRLPGAPGGILESLVWLVTTEEGREPCRGSCCELRLRACGKCVAWCFMTACSCPGSNSSDSKRIVPCWVQALQNCRRWARCLRLPIFVYSFQHGFQKRCSLLQCRRSRAADGGRTGPGRLLAGGDLCAAAGYTRPPTPSTRVRLCCDCVVLGSPVWMLRTNRILSENQTHMW